MPPWASCCAEQFSPANFLSSLYLAIYWSTSICSFVLRETAGTEMLNTPRRLLITVAVLLAWRLGLAIPVPGLTLHSDSFNSLQALPSQFRTPGWSLLMLGVIPLFSALISVEILKIAWPGFHGWEAVDRRGKGRLRRYIFIASLAFAAMQALVLLPAYERMAKPPGIVFEVAFVTGLVAGAALMCWFADVITLYGIGNGFWMLLGLPILAGSARNIWLYLNMYIPTQAELEWVAIGLVFVAIFLLVFVQYPRLNFRGNGDSPQKERDHWADGGLMATCWPPILANWVASWVVALAIIYNLPADLGAFAMIAAGMVLIPLFTTLRENVVLKQDVNGGNLSQKETKPILILALVQAVIWAVPLLWKQLNGQFPAFMDGYSLIIATTIALDLMRRLIYLRERRELRAAAPSA
jgi:preprotein translocase subunit SecY